MRRAMWLMLRLESEHLHNTEGFRRVDVVPLHFDHAETEQERATRSSKEAMTSRRVEVVVEVLVYTAVVAVLVVAAVSEFTREPERPPNDDDGPGNGSYLVQLA